MIDIGYDIESEYHILYLGSREGISGTQIEKYYDEFKYIRLVPYSAIRKKGIDNDAYDFSRFIHEFQNLKVSRGIDFYQVVEDDVPIMADRLKNYFYKVMKMTWLINNIRKNGIKEPITAVVYPRYNSSGIVESFHVVPHPGTFRYRAFELMQEDPLCIIFDAYDVFPEYGRASLKEILELFNDGEPHVEVSILPNNQSQLTPQILNMRKDSINQNVPNHVHAWQDSQKNMWNKPINIFVGYDSSHGDQADICIKSIRDSFTIKENCIKIHKLDIAHIKEYKRNFKNQSTEFAYSRFLVPYLSNYEGMSIFVDDDFIFKEDIINTLFFMTKDHAVACVKHDFKNKYETKFNNTKDVWYEKKLWSSLMVFNNAHPDCKKLTPDVINSADGSYLHRFEWTTEEKISELPKVWNWCEGYSDIEDIHVAKGIHYTRGGPWIKNMDCSNIEGLGQYYAYKYGETLRSNGVERKRLALHDVRKYYDIENAERDNTGAYICKEIKE